MHCCVALSLISQVSFAADYNCTSPFYDVDISLDDISTHIWVTDRVTDELLHMGYTAWEKKESKKVVYYFYPQSGDQTNIYVSNEVIKIDPEKMSIFVSGVFTWTPVHESMRCTRR